MYLDNYSKDDNGRIWLASDDCKVELRQIKSTSQMIHCGVYDLNGNFQNWLTVVHVLNHLEQRRTLWKDIEKLHHQQQWPWCLLGDFNNVMRT